MHCCLDGCSCFIIPKEGIKIHVYFQNRDTVNQTDWFACMFTLKHYSSSGPNITFFKARSHWTPNPQINQMFLQGQEVSPGEHEAAMRSWGQEGKRYPRQKVEACNPSLLLDTSEASPGVLGPVLDSSVQGWRGHTGEGPAKAHCDEGMEKSLLWRKAFSAEKDEHVQDWEEKAQGDALVYINTRRDGAKRTEPDTFQCCQDQKSWTQTEMQEPLSEHQETLCYCEYLALSQVAQKGCGVSLPGRHLKAIWIWPWALDVPGWTRVWTRWPQEVPFNLICSVILWYIKDSFTLLHRLNHLQDCLTFLISVWKLFPGNTLSRGKFCKNSYSNDLYVCHFRPCLL